MADHIADGRAPGPGQPALGVVMLDTVFPRPPGDIGNPATFAFATRYQRVPAASPRRVVFGQAEGLGGAFVEAALALQAQGCQAIVTSCGFLALHHREMAAALRVPFASSALCWLPTLYQVCGGPEAVGVLTASAGALSDAHLEAVGGSARSPRAGMDEAGEFARVILGNQPEGDMARVGQEVVETAVRFAAAHPRLRALVLECTNMPPYAAEIARRCRLPVFDLVSLARQLMAGAGAR